MIVVQVLVIKAAETMHEVQKTTVMSCKKNIVFVEFCGLCSGRLIGRRHTLSDNLPEDLQKFNMVSAYVRHVT